MTEPLIKGWCPSAYKPMMSGDGLIVRIRPICARLSAEQAIGLCDLASTLGSGVIELTSRANLQLRGVKEHDYLALLGQFHDLGLVDANPTVEQRRNIIVNPFFKKDDLTDRLYKALTRRLETFPPLPAKVGFAIDTGDRPTLQQCSADFRIEKGIGDLVLRADGCATGRHVTEHTVIGAMAEMVRWFDQHRTPELRRMAALASRMPLPSDWRTAHPLPPSTPPTPGQRSDGTLIGAAFGLMNANALSKLMNDSGARGIRVTPWRMVLLENVWLGDCPEFITTPHAPLMRVDACPGAPLCPQATVPTRRIAQALAGKIDGSLHVSGCAKGCARPRRADTTLVGRDGCFDLVKDGHAWDAPMQTGLTANETEFKAQ